MWARKISSRLRLRKRTSIITLFTMLAIARTHPSSAACGLPSTIALSSVEQAEANTSFHQNGAPKLIPSGRNESIIDLWSITATDSFPPINFLK